jgi:hypothetical protein
MEKAGEIVCVLVTLPSTPSPIIIIIIIIIMALQPFVGPWPLFTVS